MMEDEPRDWNQWVAEQIELERQELERMGLEYGDMLREEQADYCRELLAEHTHGVMRDAEKEALDRARMDMRDTQEGGN
jgi:hypothetical protein